MQFATKANNSHLCVAGVICDEEFLRTIKDGILSELLFSVRCAVNGFIERQTVLR